MRREPTRNHILLIYYRYMLLLFMQQIIQFIYVYKINGTKKKPNKNTKNSTDNAFISISIDLPAHLDAGFLTRN